MNRKNRHLLCAASFLFLLPYGLAAEESWRLMSRHGECSPISSLVRKFPDLRGVTSPDEFLAFVRAKGLEAQTKTHSSQGMTFVEVLVPRVELAVVFVDKRSCSSVGK